MSDRYVPTPVGFARSSMEPLDKYELFTGDEGICELIEYVKSGPAYSGQVCKVTHADKSVSEYQINGDHTSSRDSLSIKPLYTRCMDEIVINDISDKYDVVSNKINWFTNLPTDDNGNAITPYWTLVYNYEYTLNDNILFKSSDRLGFLPDAFCMSVLNDLEIYRNKSDNYFYFMIVKDNVVAYVWKQYKNPLTNIIPDGLSDTFTNNILLVKDYNNAYGIVTLRSDQNTVVTHNEKKITLFPKQASDCSIALYVRKAGTYAFI